MSHKFCLNMELLSLSIAETCISKMTNSNYSALSSEEAWPYAHDEEALKNNLSAGFIAVTMLHCYYESFLNTILRDFLGYNPEGSVIKGGEAAKLEIIFNGNEDKLIRIKNEAYWRDAHRILKLRNHLIHYKNNMSDEYSSYPPIKSWEIGNEILNDFFLKAEVEKCSNAIKLLVSDIAHVMNLEVGKETDPIICDYPYIMRSVQLDEERLTEK